MAALETSDSTVICVLGSANMDLVALVQRMPSPGETVTGRAFVQMPGGKGANQALAAARAGGPHSRVEMLGAVGADEFGTVIRRILDTDGVATEGLLTCEEPTGTAHILVDDQGRNSIVVVPGANGGLHALTNAQRDAISASQVLLLQLELPLAIVTEAARWARDHDTEVILTPAPVVPLPDDLLGRVDLLIPNQHEAAQLTDESDPRRAAAALLDRQAGAVVITLGEAGCLYASVGSEPIHMAAPAVTAVDTTAAGDTFAGCLAVALAEGRTVPEALAWATTAAALSVQRIGASASMPRRNEIDARLATVGREGSS